MSRRVRAEAPSSPVPVRLSPAERVLVLRAAAANHQNVSEFARDALVGAAGDCLELRATLSGRVFVLSPTDHS